MAEIAFELDKIGDLSPVVSRPEGIFLVRLGYLESAMRRSFESVGAELEQEEHNRLREELETTFEADIAAKYP